MITQDVARLAINNLGLDALGLASGQLTTRWSTGSVSFDSASARLTTSGTWRAMASGTLHWRPFGAPELSGVDGASPTGAMAVLRLHPQTHLRLVRLYAQRFEGNNQGRSLRPVPYTIAFHDITLPDELDGVTENDPPAKPDRSRVGAELVDGSLWRLDNPISFHDERGLIIDPVAVACAFRELLRGFTALRLQADAAADLDAGAGAGTLGAIHQLATGRRVHFVDLHGGPYVPPAEGGVQIGTTAITGPGPHDWPDGQSISRQGTTSAIRFAFATHGQLGTNALDVPAFPGTAVPAGSATPTLPRDFFRIATVDLNRHLLGNRSADEVEGIPAPDTHTRAEAAPQVHESEVVELHVDGQATLGAMQEVRAGRPVDLAVSPIVALDFDLPPDDTQRWPAFPAPVFTPEAWDPANAGRIRTDWSARFIGTTNDVELTLPAGIAPREASVRAFPRVFIEGPALADSPSAERGEGGSTIVGDGEVRILLRDPFRLGSNSQPTNAKLRFDVVVAPRPAGQPARSRLFGGLLIPIASGGTAITAPATTRALADVPANQRGESRAPVFGLTPSAPATGTLERILQALSEATPREAPRFPTMARNDSMLIARDNATPASWDAVLTNGWLDRRSLRADARLGNPGNPAGPEERVVGVRTTAGRLAHDIGRATLRRTKHLIPRLIELDNNSFNTPAAGTGTVAGALLQTIAPFCENPELAVLNNPSTLPSDWNGVVALINSIIPGAGSLIPSTPAAGDRWAAEVKRDAMAAKHGRRDAQWALRWQIGHARTLIYIESALFGPSAESGVGDHGYDFVADLVARLGAAKGLHLIISVPRLPPFGPGYEGWAKRFHELRNTALDQLIAAAPKRVLVFHPVGFPGRPEVQRGNVVIVDDVFAMIGSSTLSRRGLTFDGGLDVALLDRDLRDGASVRIRDFRRALMALTLGKTPPAAGDTPDPGWVRLGSMLGAFAQFREVLIDHEGEGLIQQLFRGPGDDEVLAQSRAIADPEGRDFNGALVAGSALAAALATLGGGRV